MSDTTIFTNEKIKSICDGIPEIERIENLRIKFLKRRKKFILIILAILAFSVPIVVLGIDMLAPWAPAVIFVLIALTFIILYCTMVLPVCGELKTMFRDNLIKNYVNALLTDAKYVPENYHPIEKYYKSLLYMTHVDRHSGENYVEGKFDKTALSFSYMHTEYKQVTHTKRGTQTTWYTIFCGVFLCADSNKHFAGKTVVLPDTAEKYFGGFGKWLQRNIGNPVGQVVYMENKKFEKEFAVYSTDPVEARYLITPKIQEEIVNIKKMLKTDFRLSFVDENIFVTIARDKIFKLKYSLSFTKPETLKYYMQDMLELLTLVHLLDLNVRIWSKQ